MFDKNTIYQEDLGRISKLDLPWGKLKNSSILITGATGLIGTFLIDLLMNRNANFNDNITIYAMGRNEKTAKDRFADYLTNKNFIFVSHDVSIPLIFEFKVNYIIHAASNTHPIAYSRDPVGTMTTNFIGLLNLLNYSLVANVRRVIFLSTVEIYGENRGDSDSFDESYCGYIDCNTMRSCYPESKRAAEALCASFIKQYNADIVIPRLCRIYGPTMTREDSKVVAQFIHNVISEQDIIMKSQGQQMYSYCYVADCVSGILTTLLLGQNGQAYNIANRNSNVTIREMAEIIAGITSRKIKFEDPDAKEKAGYSKVTKAVLDAEKLERLGWEAQYDMKTGLRRTIQILSQSQNK